MTTLPEQSRKYIRVRYEESGYYFPIRALEDSEVADFHTCFFDYLTQNKDRLKRLRTREHYLVFSQTHAMLGWVYRMVSHPRVLDAVESILGPNLLVWDSGWFAKIPGETKYVAWHQDSLYFGLRPLELTTAWIALTESDSENGCLRVIPGSHRRDFPHRETDAPDNSLSRGQEISVQVEESQAVDVVLKPGEVSLHHAAIVHGSKANISDRPRIGLAVRYLTPVVVHEGPRRQFGLLVRGRDDRGHFELLEAPVMDSVSSENSIQLKILERMGVKV